MAVDPSISPVKVTWPLTGLTNALQSPKELPVWAKSVILSSYKSKNIHKKSTKKQMHYVYRRAGDSGK